MSYDVVARFDAAAHARVAEVVLRTSGVRDDGPGRWVLDVFAEGGARFFSVDVLEKSWLGKPRALRLSLPFGGSVAEARTFAEAVQALAVRLVAVVTDATDTLTPGREAEDALARWRAANAAALAGWEVGFVVRPGNATGCGRTACPEVAPQADGPLSVTSLVSAHLRGDALEEARAVVSRAIDRLGPSFELGRLLATIDARRADPTGERARTQELVDALAHGDDEEGATTDALRKLGAPAVPALLDAFGRTSGSARFGVEGVLQWLREPTREHVAARVRDGAARDEIATLVDFLARLAPDAAAAEAVTDRLLREPGVPGVELEGFLSAALRSDPAAIASVLRLIREGDGEQVEHAARATTATSWAHDALGPLLERILSQRPREVDEGDPHDPPSLFDGHVSLWLLVDQAALMDHEVTVRTLEAARAAPDATRRARALEALRVLGESRDVGRP